MKNLILILCLFLSCFFHYQARAKVTDTISFWHIRYNHELLLQLNQHSVGYEISVGLDTLSEDDMFTVQYSPGCLFCSECKVYLGIYDQNKKLVQYEDAVGSWTPISISLRKILIHHDLTGQSVYDFYYSEGKASQYKQGVHVLRIYLV